MNIVTTIITHHEYFWVIIVVTIFMEDDTMTILVHFTITLLIHNIMSARYRESAFLDHHILTFNQYDYEVLCSTRYHAFVQDLPRFPTGSKQLHFHFGLHPPILKYRSTGSSPGPRQIFAREKYWSGLQDYKTSATLRWRFYLLRVCINWVFQLVRAHCWLKDRLGYCDRAESLS